MRSLNLYGRWVVFFHLVVWVGLTAFIVITESRFPGSDVFLFKEAAVNFALKSKLVASNLVYMPLDIELPFAHYPPVYPLVAGVWMKIFGIGLKQSLLFECLRRGLRSFLLGALIWPSLRAAFREKSLRGWATFTVFFLTLISLVSTDDDRPDELGLVFGLTCWWILLRVKKTSEYILAGLLLGITGATSPACSVCIGLGCVFYLFASKEKAKDLVLLVGGALVTFIACVAPIPLFHPEVIKRFSVSANASSLPYPIPWLNGVPFSQFWSRFQYCMNHYIPAGFNLVLCTSTLLVVLVFFRWKRKLDVHPFQWSTLVFIFIAPFIWSLQPYYLWFAVLPISVFFIGNLLSPEFVQRKLGFIAVVIAFFPSVFHESKNFIAVINRPDQENMAYIREQLLKEIKPSERVAVTFDQFFTLRNEREVAEVGLVCKGIERFDYIYVTRIWSAKQGQSELVPIPCWNFSRLKCFEPVKNLTTQHQLKIAGFNTGYNVRGHGGTLYKNIRCTEQISHRLVPVGSNRS